MSVDMTPSESSVPGSTALARAAVLTYGLLSYAIFLVTFLYLIGFIAGAIVPKTIDSGPTGAVGQSILINLGLLGLFAIQHTIMARTAFKRWFMQIVQAPIERSTFVLLSSLILILLAWQWRPLPESVWQVGGSAAIALYLVAGMGWGIVLLSTFLIDHFDLFGLKQAFAFATGRPHTGPRFRERLLYKVCRHPLMLGFLIAFWATPAMTVGHLLFAAVATGYVLVALRIEEVTLLELHPTEYASYQRRVRMLIPIPRRTSP